MQESISYVKSDHSECSTVRRSVELAKEKGVVVREAMTISHMPLYKKLKERIKEGAIGNTKMVQVNFGSNKGYDSTQRFLH